MNSPAFFWYVFRAKETYWELVNQGETPKPRGSCHGIFELVSSSWETLSRARWQEGAVAYLCFTFNEVWWSTSVVSWVPRHNHCHQILQHSAYFFSRPRTVWNEPNYNLLWLKIKPNRGQLRHSATAFSRFFQALLYPIQKELFGIFLANYLQSTVQAPGKDRKNSASKAKGRARNWRIRWAKPSRRDAGSMLIKVRMLDAVTFIIFFNNNLHFTYSLETRDVFLATVHKAVFCRF